MTVPFVPQVYTWNKAASRDVGKMDAEWQKIQRAFGAAFYPILPDETGVVNPWYPYGNVFRYGATGDGVTDDLKAINNASASIDALGGGVVFLPVGTYAVSNTVVVPNRVVFNGEGRDIGPTGAPRGTTILAMASFPINTPVVQLADGSAQAFGCRVQNLCIHCRAIAGSVGVFSAVAQESSGLQRVTIRGFMATGVSFTDTTSVLFNGNFLLSEVEIFCDTTATGTIGFYWLSKNGAFGFLERVSINSKNTSVDQTAGISVVNGGVGTGKGQLIVQGANIEGQTDGILVGADTLLVASGVGGYVSQGGGTNVIRIASGGRAVLSGIYRTSYYTNTITDTAAGVSVTDQTVLQYFQGVATEQVPVVTLTDASFIVCDASLSTAYVVTLGASRTMASPSNKRSGKRITITVIQDGTGGWTLAWNAVFKVSWSDTGNTAGKRSTISFIYDGTNFNQDGAQTPYV